jgi:hypothetical protein
MDWFSNRKPFAQKKFNRECVACGLKVSDGLSVSLPIDVCHCDIMESILLLDVLYELAVTSQQGRRTGTRARAEVT